MAVALYPFPLGEGFSGGAGPHSTRVSGAPTSRCITIQGAHSSCAYKTRYVRLLIQGGSDGATNEACHEPERRPGSCQTYCDQCEFMYRARLGCSHTAVGPGPGPTGTSRAVNRSPADPGACG